MIGELEKQTLEAQRAQAAASIEVSDQEIRPLDSRLVSLDAEQRVLGGSKISAVTASLLWPRLAQQYCPSAYPYDRRSLRPDNLANRHSIPVQDSENHLRLAVGDLHHASLALISLPGSVLLCGVEMPGCSGACLAR